MAVAQSLADVELVSIDSMQVYKGMDVGTAKPSRADRSSVRHHLLDLVDPTDEFNVADFQLAYRTALDGIGARGNRALLVGGTGLYHRAVVDELTLPGQWGTVRARLELEASLGGLGAMFARLELIDPAGASKIEPTNLRRIVRALEVCEGSGQMFSSFGAGIDSYPPTPVAQVGLRWERGVLATRIEQRVEAMMSAGLLEEVTALAAEGLSRTAAQALGYKELLTHINGRISLDQAVAQIVVHTRQFAARQERWFRRDPRVRWIDITHDPVVESVTILAEAFDSATSSQ